MSVWKTDVDGATIATGASFALYRAEDFDDTAHAPKAQTAPLAHGRTNAQGILALGSLAEGEYRLVETEAPEGYVLATSAIKIYVFHDHVEAQQGGNVAEVAVKGDPTWVSGQDESTWQVRVWNSGGLELPASGGKGVSAFGSLGVALLVLGALAMMARNGRRAA